MTEEELKKYELLRELEKQRSLDEALKQFNAKPKRKRVRIRRGKQEHGDPYSR